MLKIKQVEAINSTSLAAYSTLAAFLPNRFTRNGINCWVRTCWVHMAWLFTRGIQCRKSFLVPRRGRPQQQPTNSTGPVTARDSPFPLAVLPDLPGWSRSPPLPSRARATTIRHAREPNIMATITGTPTWPGVSFSSRSIWARPPTSPWPAHEPRDSFRRCVPPIYALAPPRRVRFCKA